MIKALFAFLMVLIVVGCGSSQHDKKFDRAAPEAVPTAVSGEILFKRNCSQCHLPNKDFIGPSLAGVESRWKSKELLYKFIKNSQEVIKTDPYAKELFIKWKELPMLPYPQLSDADIDAILDYSNEAAAPK